MNYNLKLILLGLIAMLLTFVVFTAIEAAIIRPRVTPGFAGQSEQPGTQVAAATPDLSSQTGIPATSTRSAASTPVLLLTLPSEPFASSPTPSSTVGVTSTPEASPGTPSKDTPSATDVSGQTQTPTADNLQPTGITPTNPNIPSGTAGIQGRVLFNSGLFSGTIVLKLVDPESNDVQQFTFMDGEYNLQNLLPSQKGYQVVFSRENNPQLSQNQVIPQVMAGPLPAGDGSLVKYPDFDIALLGLEPLEPDPNREYTDHPITPQQPVRFMWNDYPSFSQYRVELRPANSSQPVWVSGYVSTESIVFDGVLSSGALIERGTYSWSVSARNADGTITVFGPSAELTLNW